MGHLLGAIDQAALDEQRGVVQNEKRQGENQPYGRVFRVLRRVAYPAGHPYHWAPIGSMEDLNAASLDDVKHWFRTWYGAENAVLVLAGDIDPATANEKVREILRRHPARAAADAPGRGSPKRTTTAARSGQKTTSRRRAWIKVWNVPPYASDGRGPASGSASVLGGGKTSRLDQRLVHERPDRDEVDGVDGSSSAGLFVVEATCSRADLAARSRGRSTRSSPASRGRPDRGGTRTRVKARMRPASCAASRTSGASAARPTRSPSARSYGRARMLQARSSAPGRDPDAGSRCGAAWLRGRPVIEVRPVPERHASGNGADRSKPSVRGRAARSVPGARAHALQNGLELIVVERHDVPLVRFELLVDAGYAADRDESAARQAALALLPEGTQDRTASRSPSSSRCSAPSSDALESRSLDRRALRAAREPRRLARDLRRRDPASRRSRPRTSSGAASSSSLRSSREEKTPLQLALRLFPRLLYGAGIPTLARSRARGRRSGRAPLARGPRELPPRLVSSRSRDARRGRRHDPRRDRCPGSRRCSASGSPGEPARAGERSGRVRRPQPRSLYLIDRPGAQQSLIVAGDLAPEERPPRRGARRVQPAAGRQLLGAPST